MRMKKEPFSNGFVKSQSKITARCSLTCAVLAEGVDVPALDAVIFLSPRKSQVEVVQTVGRVMRRAPGKKRGYVILPLVVDNLSDIDNALSRSDKFACIWQVLKALKAINPNDVIVDGARKAKLPYRSSVR